MYDDLMNKASAAVAGRRAIFRKYGARSKEYEMAITAEKQAGNNLVFFLLLHKDEFDMVPRSKGED